MDSSDLPLTAQHGIDQACDALEAAWRTGVRPRVEDFLGNSSGQERAAKLARLIELEIALRERAGERPAPDEFLVRFPGDSAVVLWAFQNAGKLGGTNGDRRDPLGVGTPSMPATPTPGRPRPPSTQPMTDHAATPAAEPLPERFGRFVVKSFLGKGGFGRVYRAYDPDLDRDVALKVPHAGALGRYDEALLTDARSAAKLGHHGIVRIYDLVRLDDGGLIVTMELVEGRSLEEVLRAGRPAPAAFAGLLRRVAEAVQHAHERGLVHRDLKPSNVMIDAKDQPKVTDFGLAVGGEAPSRPGEVAGTPEYMAPEQVRGETHRIDARTDIWALGVILYRGLTGEKPFLAATRGKIFDQVLHREPPPPRRIAPELPRELDRIVMRCLSKRMDDRYATAAELAEDLADWEQVELRGQAEGPPSESGREGILHAAATAGAVLPRGLRPYDGDDAGFFLGLIPGQRGRGALPESLRFWKSRIESREAGGTSQSARAFHVGLLYGPSGGGKSSFVRAGLLPRLDARVVRVYVEATPETTESRLLTELRREVPGLPGDDLPEAVAAIRAGRAGIGPSRKVLIVLDQFEQWLQAHPELDLGLPLVRALRQCDGLRAQALVLVRDDFWFPVSRFFKVLEVPLAEKVNMASVELPDAGHARRVLVEYGRNCGRLPESGPLGPEASRFLDEAVAGLSGPDGRIVPVRLSLFNEVARRHEWTPGTLRALGGMAGIGVTYLKQTFDSPSAPPSQRARRKQAQAVLRALLPPPGALIRGVVRSSAELGEAARLAEDPGECAELLRMLDGELRLITEVDPRSAAGLAGDGDAPGRGDAGEATAPHDGERFYQLAHDDLVLAVRSWLAEEESGHSAGRARLRLATITAVWTDSPGPRRLPSVTEWLSILWHVPPRRWSPDQRRMMLAATRHHTGRIALAGALLVALGIAGRRWERQASAEAQAARVLGFDLTSIPSLLPDLEKDRDDLLPPLRRAERDPGPSVGRKRNALVLLHRFEPTPERARALLALIPAAEPEELAVIRDALAIDGGGEVVGPLWEQVGDPSTEPRARLCAAAVLAALAPEAPGWAAGAPGAASNAGLVASALLAEEPGRISRWCPLLDPAARAIVPAIAEALGGVDVPAQVFREAMLALFAQRRAGEAADAHEAILGRLDAEPDPPASDIAARDLRALRRAAAVAGLVELGRPERAWPLLRHREDPRLRAFLVDRLARYAVNPPALIDRLGVAGADPCELQGVLMALAEMAELRADRLGPVALDSLADRAFDLARDHPDPGVHSAAGLVLRRLGRGDRLAAAEASAGVAVAPRDGMRWFVGHNGHTFAVAALGEGWIGARPFEEGYQDHERPTYLRVGRTVAVSTHEVTYGQYARFRADFGHDTNAGPGGDYPANSVDWFEAARYCNWLSDRAGLPRCYPEPIGPGMTLDPAAVKAGGYRLPTEAEWEMLCRAGTVTARPFGDSDAIQGRYACGWVNSGDRTLPAGRFLPNELGLFDTLGNVWEWCHDGARIPRGQEFAIPAYPDGTPERPAAERLEAEAVWPEKADAGAGAPASLRFTRGGAYDYANSHARSGKRSYGSPDSASNFDGFRVVRTISTE